MMPEQEILLRDMARNKETNELSAAITAILAERDELRSFVGDCTPAMLDGKTAFSRFYDMVDRCEKAEAERDAALAAMNRANDLITLTEAERDAALAKLGAVSELLAECREVLNNYPRSLGYDITHVRKIDAALASTPEPEIVAVVDGYLEAGARYETAEDFGDGGFCSRSGYQNDEVPVRAIIVKAEHPEPSPCSDPKKP